MNKDFKNAFVVVCMILVLTAVLFVFIGSYITAVFPQSPWAYAIQYNTEAEYVVIDPKPHDCEFDKAPIGNKYCHFDKIVTTKNGDESVNHKSLVMVTWSKVSE